MLDKLAEVEKRYVELEGMMSDPQLLGHQREYSKLAKERSELEEIVSCYREWRKVEHKINDNRQLLEEADEGIRDLAKEELVGLREHKEALEERLKILILPKDPNDDKNVIEKFAPARAAMRRPCSPPSFFACIRVMPNRAAGASK
jgi:peptide chain release factor 1